MRSPAMKWSPPLVSATLAGLLFGTATQNWAQPQPTDDSHGVRAQVKAYARVWNTHEATALAAFFTPDADMIMGSGPRIRGRNAIEDWWNTYFSQIDPGRLGTFTIDSIRLITPAVALVNVDTITAGDDLRIAELKPRLARGTWVVVRQDDKWLITAMRGQPAEGEMRHSPGRDR